MTVAWGWKIKEYCYAWYALGVTGTDIFNPFSSMYSCISYPCLVKGGGDGGGAGDGGEGVLAPDGLDAADAQREVATEARVDVFAVAEIAG